MCGSWHACPSKAHTGRGRVVVLCAAEPHLTMCICPETSLLCSRCLQRTHAFFFRTRDEACCCVKHKYPSLHFNSLQNRRIFYGCLIYICLIICLLMLRAAQVIITSRRPPQRYPHKYLITIVFKFVAHSVWLIFVKKTLELFVDSSKLTETSFRCQNSVDVTHPHTMATLAQIIHIIINVRAGFGVATNETAS